MRAIVGRLDAIDARIDVLATTAAVEALGERIDDCTQALQRSPRSPRSPRGDAAQSPAALDDATGARARTRARAGAAVGLLVLAGLLHRRARRRLNGMVRRLPPRTLLLVNLLVALLLGVSGLADALRASLSEVPLRALSPPPSSRRAPAACLRTDRAVADLRAPHPPRSCASCRLCPRGLPAGASGRRLALAQGAAAEPARRRSLPRGSGGVCRRHGCADPVAAWPHPGVAFVCYEFTPLLLFASPEARARHLVHTWCVPTRTANIKKIVALPFATLKKGRTRQI